MQLVRPPTLGDRLRLTSDHGLRLAEYLPNLAFLERLAPRAVAGLEADELVRAVVPFAPAFKLEPGLGRSVGAPSVRSPSQAPPFRGLVVVGFADAAAAALRAEIEALGLDVVSANDQPGHVPQLVVRTGDPDAADSIALLPDVRWIEDVGELRLNDATQAWVIQTNVVDNRKVWDHGLRGTDQIVGHIDEPVDIAHCFFRDPVDNTPRPDHRKVVGLRNASGPPCGVPPKPWHGTATASVAVGDDFTADSLSATPNPGNGNAPRAKLTTGSICDLDVAGGTKTFFNYLGAAHADGARIHSNSWEDPTSSAYTQRSVDLDTFTWQNEDDLVLVAGENEGGIHPPATAKNALVVNATKAPPNQDDYSSGVREFTRDVRRKPDLMAPGEHIVLALHETPCGLWERSGTSYATPAVGAAAALVRQYYTEGWYPTGAADITHAIKPTGALLKATLLNATVDMTALNNYPGDPETGEGWGRLLLDDALFFVGDGRHLSVVDVRHASGVTMGQVRRHKFKVAASAEPLKITLVWTEPPGPVFPGGVVQDQPVVNDLDLRVTSPDGADTFLGNNIIAGESIHGGVPDKVNNVEMVIVTAPATGKWTVEVVGTKVFTGDPGQGYALVVTADLTTGPCFIAGAVYGDEGHPDVVFLRDWRDARLDRPAMRFLAAVYDHVGPRLARAVDGRPRLAALLRRGVLAPLVALLRGGSDG